MPRRFASSFQRPILSRLSQLAATSLLLALTAGAQAQTAGSSSVQLYGLIDAAVGSFKDTGGARSTQVSSGNLTTSYFGFKGREDLGGGLYSFFALESYFRGDTGEGARYTGDSLYSRAAFVGLGSDIGALRLGRVGTPLFTNTLVYNPLASSFAFSPSIRNIFGAGARVAGDSGWNNAVAYTSPTVAGLTANLIYGMREAAQGANVSAALQYTAGAFSVGLVGQQVKVPFKSGEETTWQIGSYYDFSVVKLFGQYTRVSETATATTTANTRDNVAQLGVSVPLGAGALLASWSEARTSGSVAYDRSFTTVGYDYRLSKRTDVYAMAMTDKRSDLSRGNSVGIGMRHVF